MNWNLINISACLVGTGGMGFLLHTMFQNHHLNHFPDKQSPCWWQKLYPLKKK